jgi:hypothetical protein
VVDLPLTVERAGVAEMSYVSLAEFRQTGRQQDGAERRGPARVRERYAHK